MHILGRSNPKKESRSYRQLRAAYMKDWYPITRVGMGSRRPGKLPRLNGTNGGYGTFNG